MSRTSDRPRAPRAVVAFVAFVTFVASAAALVGAADVAAQQPIGTPLGSRPDAAPQHAVQPMPVPVSQPASQPASRTAAAGTSHSEESERRAPQVATSRPSVVDGAAPRVTRIDVATTGDDVTVIVEAGAVAWSISEPYYHADHVRLHLDIAAPALPRVVAPPAGGALIGLNVVAEPGRTRIEIDAAELGGYEAREEDGRILVRITPPVAVAQPTAADAMPAALQLDDVSAAPSRSLTTVVHAAGVRALDRARRTAADIGAATGPARGSAAAPAAVALLTIVVAGGMLLRRRREPPRSVMLGAARPGGSQPVRPSPPPRSRRSDAAPSKRGRPGNTAQGLAEAGLSHAEIAARLRVSRDVVTLMLATAREADDAAGSGRNCPAVRVPARRGVFGSRR